MQSTLSILLAKFNFINKKENDYAGYSGVEYLEHGIHTMPPPAAESLATSLFDFLWREARPSSVLRGAHSTPASPIPAKLSCGGSADTKFTVTNEIASTVKFRTCNAKVDPNTGWACNHGIAFQDCKRRIKQGETVELDMDSGVQSILPITFTAQGAIDQVSACYIEMPSGGWSATTMTLDDAWWQNLQASC